MRSAPTSSRRKRSGIGLSGNRAFIQLELHGSSKESDTYEIELPEGYTVDDIPDPVNIDVGFASYQSKTEIKGQTLSYHREYVVRSVEIDPEKFAQLKAFEGRIGADERAAVVLKKAP